MLVALLLGFRVKFLALDWVLRRESFEFLNMEALNLAFNDSSSWINMGRFEVDLEVCSVFLGILPRGFKDFMFFEVSTIFSSVFQVVDV
jgi:hypothetical protein